MSSSSADGLVMVGCEKGCAGRVRHFSAYKHVLDVIMGKVTSFFHFEKVEDGVLEARRFGRA